AAPDPVKAMTSEERRRMVADASRFGRDLGELSRNPKADVTGFFQHGTLRLIFILDRRLPQAARDRWRAEVRAANIASAVGEEQLVRQIS
ncbi:MAG: hypothetical protein M3135_03990, partial [Actinomycetota bacterium]|nr:hypothetical protein [Actinomycetota bacterium]